MKYSCHMVIVCFIIIGTSCADKQKYAHNIGEQNIIQKEFVKQLLSSIEISQSSDSVITERRNRSKRASSHKKDTLEVDELKIHPMIILEEDHPIGCNLGDQFPQFPGGDKELMKFLSENIRYPAQTAEEGLDGRILIRFVVDREGCIINTKILEGLDTYSEKEVVRVVNSMPRWIPARMNGRTAAVSFILPILFELKN